MLQGLQYVPLLYAKRAELRALNRLDKLTRDSIFPIVAVRPWPNAKQLEAIYPRLKEALSDYRYGLDLDRHKRGKIGLEPVSSQFEALFDPLNGFSNYYDLVGEDSNRIPVLRDCDGMYVDLQRQFDRIDALHNGVIIRLQKGCCEDLTSVIESGRLIADDILFAVDVGWSLDVIAQEMWASQMISKITDWDPTAEIVCLSSSFPNSFTHIEYRGTFSIDDRDLFDRLVRRHNSARLVYGDWGSTRRSEEQGGGTHYDRIDTAKAGEWVSFRQTDEESGYQIVAKRTIADPQWTTLPTCWGKHVIECTALDIPGKIKGTEAAISSRINMHITAQANVGVTAPPPDEPYLDPF
jgi:hypothetical protein